MAVLLVGHVVAGLALLLALGGLAALLARGSVAADVVLAGGDLVGDAALGQQEYGIQTSTFDVQNYHILSWTLE